MKKIYSLLVALSLSFAVFSQTIILQEDFQGSSTPANWTKTSNGIGWEFGTCSGAYWSIPSTPPHTNYAYSDDVNNNGASNDASVDYLITPALDLTSNSAVVMKFATYNTGYSPQGASPVLTIEVTTDNGTNWTLISTVVYDNNWNTITVPLSAYAGQSNVKVAFHWDDQGIWSSGVGIDDVIIYEPNPYDVAMISINNTEYLQNGNINIEGTFKNMGSVTLTSIEVNWSTDGGTTVHTDSLTGLSVAAAETYDFTHSVACNMSATQTYNVKVWVSNPNGNSDGEPSNDEITKTITSLSQIPTKVVVGEEGTGTWCGWCIGGLVALKDLKHYHPDTWIGISIHCTTAGEEPMWYPGYNLYPGKLSGLPAGLIDRQNNFEELGISDFDTIYNERAALITPVAVEIQNIDWNSITKEVNFDVAATFYTNISADFRISAVIKEDHVTGIGEFWAQHNYYHGSTSNILIDWEGINYNNLPDPIPAADMEYNDVARKIFGGWEGTSGSIPSTIVDGTTYTHSYTYSVPDSINIDNLTIVGMVINQTTSEIMNAKENGVILGLEQTENSNNKVLIYPNPANNFINVVTSKNSTIEIYSINGQKIIEILNSSRFEKIDLSSYESGIYIVKIISDNKILTSKINIIN